MVQSISQLEKNPMIPAKGIIFFNLGQAFNNRLGYEI